MMINCVCGSTGGCWMCKPEWHRHYVPVYVTPVYPSPVFVYPSPVFVYGPAFVSFPATDGVDEMSLDELRAEVRRLRAEEAREAVLRFQEALGAEGDGE